MKIVHVIDYYQPQLGYQEFFLAREQARLGHDVHVITSERYNRYSQYTNMWQSVLGSRISKPGVSTENGFTVHRLPVVLEISGRVWLQGLIPLIHHLSPQLLYIHGMVSFTSVRVALIAENLPKECTLVFDSHSNEVNSLHPLRGAFYAAYRVFLTPLFERCADEIVAIDEDTRQFMVECCGMSKDAIRVIPLGADTERFRFDSLARKQTRGLFEMTSDEVVFIYAGKILPAKGVHLFVRALLQLPDMPIPTRAIIVGEGNLKYIDGIQREILDAQAEHRFTWTGAVPNELLYRYYSAADVSVWPLEVSIGTFEAQACGLPLIVGDAPVLRNRVKYGNGLLCRAGDVSDLAHKMYELAQSPQLRRSCGELGRLAVETEHNWRTITHIFTDMADRHQTNER